MRESCPSVYGIPQTKSSAITYLVYGGKWDVAVSGSFGGEFRRNWWPTQVHSYKVNYTTLWTKTNQLPLEIERGKLSWIGHTLSIYDQAVIPRHALTWNPQGKGKRRWQKKTGSETWRGCCCRLLFMISSFVSAAS